ncbi:hypothetical protein M409DRAFT_21394 [Zasmidium cellare ATCC 36951]|uniref:Uncharacterized protein n=1 Tax=Zasmidium cellare ATCC 36951 TaxID=1080233 RepID=A0A6A6CR82_ZASCE|nr:uncharacterized protein M409DRAFT_21394 [Zasmidium cellare ATCC 36951]KAF2168650.1 hypothetical protein M409DRAFT_21394 [Zasmidium cellare ATCC 36951]
MSDEILFYDLPSRGKCQCWSPNTWKTRAILNFKGIPYKTEFTPFHQLQEKLKATGISPNEPGIAWVDYSVPAIRLPSGEHLMDSLKIAHALEDLHPSPSLHLDTALHEKTSLVTAKAAGPLLPVFMPIIGRSIVLDSDSEWFETDRSQKFGCSMAEFERTKGGQQAWDAARPGMEMLRALLTEEKKDAGPFIMGSVPCYGDLVLLGLFQFFRRLGIWEKFREEYGGEEVDKLWEGGKGWVERDDY